MGLTEKLQQVYKGRIVSTIVKTQQAHTFFAANIPNAGNLLLWIVISLNSIAKNKETNKKKNLRRH